MNILAKERLGQCEFRTHEPWFDEGCSEMLDQRKQDKLQWLQNPVKINGDNLNSITCEASKKFRNIKMEYQKGKINELTTNSMNKNIWIQV
jgi:hypothetical protein